ncbi:putative phosphoglycerate kinase [Helianthus annuus]|nr:putative phosphoglycerate kinase [Helianthus annuus]
MRIFTWCFVWMKRYIWFWTSKGVTPKFSLKPLVPRLSELLGIEVKMADDCIGPDVEKLVAEIPEGGVLLLET